MHLIEPLKAVKDMSRVARKGGTVAAFERGRFESFYFYVPNDERITKLGIKLGGLYVDGVRKLEGKYFDIGNRLPTIFHEAGLREIMAEVQADTYLTSDPRRKLEDVKDELGFNLETFKETKKLDAKAMASGGASRKQIEEYNRWYERWTKSLLDDHQKLRNDTVFSTGGMVLVAGRKQE
jgi:hypothetical protein